MKKHEIKVGGHYLARVSGKLTTVRVDQIKQATRPAGYTGKMTMPFVYYVTNLATGRQTTFRSAQKFRGPALQTRTNVEEVCGRVLAGEKNLKVEEVSVEPEGEQGSDPTHGSAKTIQGLMPSADYSGPATTAPTTADAEPSSSPLSSLLRRSVQEATGETVAGYKPTEEQAAILDLLRQGGVRVLAIEAGAGTGKTSTLKMVEATLPGRGQYTAFNALLVAESKSKFRRAACNTTHSLAFRAVGTRFAHRLGGKRAKSSEIAARLGIDVPWGCAVPNPAAADLPPIKKTLVPSFLAGKVMAAVRRFCQSAAAEIGPEHFRRVDGLDAQGCADNNRALREHLLPFARKTWADLSNPAGELPGFTHDCYVKVWQLSESVDLGCDYLLLDEAQDTAEVMLDVVRRQRCLVVLVGDSAQQIYEWRGAVNAMRAFDGAARQFLSQSFRFGPAIADVANAILAGLEEPTPLQLKGLPSIPSRVLFEPDGGEATCVLCRTNAGAIATVMRALTERKRPHLVGKVDEIVSFVEATVELQRGRATGHPDLACFSSWAEVQAYVKEDEGSDLKLMVKLVDDFGPLPILDALRHMPKEADADLVVCTAHKSKGREWERVRLAGDFRTADKMDDAERRLLYVACTRAKLTLDLSDCPAFGGDDGIRVRFSAPMPTAAEQEAVAKVAPVPAQPAPVPSANGKPVPAVRSAGAEFTWAKLRDGSWGARGPAGRKPGDRITVTRRNGTESHETIKKVVWSNEDSALYSV